jgi:hypothetical protein
VRHRTDHDIFVRLPGSERQVLADLQPIQVCGNGFEDAAKFWIGIGLGIEAVDVAQPAA